MNPEATDSGFPSKEKLKSRKSIQHLFEHGLSLNQMPFKIVYLFKSPEENHSSEVRFGVSVPKKFNPKATQRNKIKRKIREAYRLQKSSLVEMCLLNKISLDMMWIYIGNKDAEYRTMYEAAGKVILKANALIKKRNN